MKNGIHGNNNQIDELTASRILSELYAKAKQENDRGFTVREINRDGSTSNIIEKF